MSDLNTKFEILLLCFRGYITIKYLHDDNQCFITNSVESSSLRIIQYNYLPIYVIAASRSTAKSAQVHSGNKQTVHRTKYSHDKKQKNKHCKNFSNIKLKKKKHFLYKSNELIVI
jgi:hypothetical protein